MRKVICIDASEGINSSLKSPLIEGEIYEVIRELVAPNGVPHYELVDVKYCCGCFRFIPLSDIDETEIHSLEVKELTV